MSLATFTFEMPLEELDGVAPHRNYEYPGCCELIVEGVEFNDHDRTLTLTLGNDHGSRDVGAQPEDTEDFDALRARYEGEEIPEYYLCEKSAVWDVDPEEGYVHFNV